MTTTKVRFGCALSVIALAVIVMWLLLGPRLRLWVFMRPYHRLVATRATEKAIVAQEGRPNEVLTTDRQLRSFASRFRPLGPPALHVESKVLIYWADPWGDAEGHAVYVFIDASGKANRVAFGG